MVKQLRSQEARHILASEGPSPSAEALEEIHAAEAAHLQGVRGRIHGHDGQVNKYSKVDSARLFSYDPETGTVMVRVDHSEIPEFWLEVPIKMDQLNAWVAEQEKAK